MANKYNIYSAMDWIGTDLFYFEGSHYLFLVDGFSQFSWFHKFGPAPTSLQVVNILKKLFLEYGAPKQIRCDGRAQFLGAFIEFCDENCITIERVSPYNLTSNSSAERNLDILKKLLKKSAHGGDDFLQQFFVLQNLPRMSGGLSPAHLFFQR